MPSETVPWLVRFAESALSAKVEAKPWRANSILPSTRPSPPTALIMRVASPIPGTSPFQVPTKAPPAGWATLAEPSDVRSAAMKILRGCMSLSPSSG